MNEDEAVEQGPILKEKKPRKQMEKKPRSEAQIAAFKGAIAKKKERDDRVREVKELAAAELVMAAKEKRTEIKSKPKPTPVDDESEEEEIVVVKKKDKKKAKRRVEIELTSSDDSDNDRNPPPPATRKLTSQQNKRSVIKIHTQNEQQPLIKKMPTLQNFFSD